MPDNDWILEQQETHKRTTRTIRCEGLSSTLSASEADSEGRDGERWRGSHAGIELRESIQTTGSTMETAQRVLDQLEPHVEAILGILGRHKAGKPLSQLEPDQVTLTLRPVQYSLLLKLLASIEAMQGSHDADVVRALHGAVKAQAHTTGGDHGRA